MSKKTEIATKSQSMYSNDFASVLQIIEQNRSQAVQIINHASVLTAWQVGAYVSNKIKNAAWGTKVVQPTSATFMDLSEKFKHHKQFVPISSAQIVSPAVRQIPRFL